MTSVATEPAPTGATRQLRARRWLRFLAASIIAFVLSVTAVATDYVIATSGQTQSVPPLDANGHYVRTGDLTTHYEQWGTVGTPIVLVHGVVESAQTWRLTARLLASTHRVYAIDVRGYGYTERVGPYNLTSDTRQLADFISALHLKKPLLVGHSSGAAIVGNYARLHPGAASGVVFMDGDGTPYGVGPTFIHHLLIDPFLTAGIRFFTRNTALASYIYHRMCGPQCPRFSADEWVRPLRVPGAEAAFKSIARQQVIGMPYTQVEQIRTPALVVYGSLDPSMTKADAVATGKRLRARVVVIDGAHHLPMLSHPERTAAILAAFAAAESRPS